MIAAFTTVVLVANVVAVAQTPAEAAPGRSPVVPKEKSVPVKPVVSRYRAPKPNPKWVTPAVTLPSGSADVPVAAAAAEAGKLPVWVGRAHTKAGVAPGRVHVQVAPAATVAAAGVRGVMLSVGDPAKTGGPVHLRLGYGAFADAYGGDWAGRLRLVALPACALTTPTVASCRTRTPVAFTQDRAAQTLQADVALAPAGSVLAAESGVSGDGGNFAATSLSPEGSWQAGGSTDSFGYQYPFTMPPVPGELMPDLKLGYSSQAQDGLTSAQNAQASVAGDGWSVSQGYVERSYGSCSQNPAGSTKTGDACWSDDNQLTLSLNGQSSTIIVDDSQAGSDAPTYHAESDGNEKIERITGATNDAEGGEYWKVTTQDGIQYYFGLNHLKGWTGDSTPVTNSVETEPVFFTKSVKDHTACYDATFAKSFCQEAYRWNLDYVVDPHQDVVSYFYANETNSYARDNASTATATYTASSRLVRIQYGQRDGQVYSTTPAGQVDLDYNGRCDTAATGCDVKTLTDDTAKQWPDVPYDQHCAANASCANTYPSFWTSFELTGVRTSALVGAGLSPVDSWALKYSFPATGEQPGTPQTTPALWLDSVTHTGLDVDGGGDTTAVTLPSTTFVGQAMTNRVDLTRGYVPFTRHRLKTITTEAGETITVDYSAALCSTCTPSDPSQNTTLSFPVFWTPPGETGPIRDYFNKYTVAAVTEDDPTGGSANDTVVTHYAPVGTPAWHYDDNPLTPADSRTWDDFRGYTGMTVTKGTAPDPVQKVTTSYYRGMDGDTLPDSGTRSVSIGNTRDTAKFPDDVRYAGMDYEEQVFNGSALVSDTITTPWSSAVLATHKLTGLPSQQAYHTGTITTRVYTPLASGTVRETRTDNAFDDLGRIVKTDDQGEVGNDADDLCTTTSYASGAGILTRTAEVSTVADRCSATPSLPADAISDARTYYDGSTTLGSILTSGDPTRTDTATSYSGSTPVFATTASATYDVYGRSLTSTDALNYKSHVTYTPATGANPSSTTTYDPLSLSTKVTFDQARALTLTTTDPASYVTTEQYDTLGRAQAVYKPGSTAGTPSQKFEYTLSNSGPSTVDTYTLGEDGQTYLRSEILYDSMLRARETQTETADGGRTISDVMYNTDGLKSEDAGPYYNSSAVGPVIEQEQAGAAGPETGYEYDQAGRLVSEDAYYNATPTWQTTHTYGGNFVTTVPPAGGTATTTVTDARGNTTDAIEYHAGVPSDYLHDPAADYDDTHYTFYPSGQQQTMTDAAGNAWTWKYNLNGDVVEAHDPDSGKTSYTYDADRHVATVTDARNKQVTTTWDKDGRRTGLWDTTSTSVLSGTNQLAAWTYDKSAKGLPYSSTSYSGGDVVTSTVAKYNAFGTADTKTDTLTGADAALVPAGGYTTYYKYTAAGAPKELWDPAAGGLGQEKISYGYATGDPTSVVTSMSSSMWNYVSAIGYSEYGQPLKLTMPTTGGNIWQTRTYDDQTHNLVDQTVTDSSTSGPVDDLSYTYGGGAVSKGTGLITKIVDSRDSGAAVDTQCYTYDYAARLQSAWSATDNCATAPTDGNRSTVGAPTGPYWQSWTYDAAGNRSTQVDHGLVDASGDRTTKYNYPAAASAQPHTLTSAGGASYAYDEDGNTVTVTGGANGNQALNWTVLSRLDNETGTAGTTQYVYDTDGNLVVRRDPGTATLYLGDTQVVLDRSTNATSATRYYSIAGTTVASRTSSNKLTYLLADRQGTTESSFDASTQAVTRRSFLPFGQARGTAPTGWSGDLGFHSGTNDTATGFENLGAREYDPTTGRFLSADPVLDSTDPEQFNGYDYADNDPVTLSDPGGTDPCSAGGAGCTYKGKNGLYYPTAEDAATLGGTLPTSTGPTGGQGGSGGGAPVNNKRTDRPNGLTTTRNSDGSLDIETFHIDPVNIGDADQYASLVKSYYYDALARGTNDNTVALLNSMYLACQSAEYVCTPSFSAELEDATIVRVKRNQGCNDDCIKRYETTVGILQGLIGNELMERASGGPRTDTALSMDVTDEDVLQSARGTNMMCPIGVESFTPDTPVEMAAGGTEPIGQIKVGDQVLATDPVTGETTARPVTAVSVHHDDDLADLLVRDAAGHVSTVHTTISHPVWDRTKRAFVEVGRLGRGDHLQNLFGPDLTVIVVVPLLGAQNMDNLTVASVHTFYVLAGGEAFLVHNACTHSNAIGANADTRIGKMLSGLYPGRQIHSQFKIYTPRGERIVDWAVENDEGGYDLYEVKANGANYPSRQQWKDDWIKENVGWSTTVIRTGEACPVCPAK